jgi:3-phosphoshikimate 1-carboxyvinyltransferase
MNSPAREIMPISRPLNATVRVPGSKSLTNRALLIASLGKGETRLTNALFSDDSRTFARALQVLGFDVALDEDSSEMKVTGLGGRIPATRAELFVGNAGTAARFLTAFLTLGTGEYILDGDARMRERPIGDLVSALTMLGAKVEASGCCPPVKIFASGLPGGKAMITGDTSSQYLSALLMVAPYAKGPTEIGLSTDLSSAPYVEMTIAIMGDFGVSIRRVDDDRFAIHPASYRAPAAHYAIESDASAASYFFAAAAICGGAVKVTNISRKSKQGDIGFLDILQRMGCVLTEKDDSVEVNGTGSLCGVDVDMRHIPDTAQTLAVVAPFADSPTRIRGIASARLKESDRIRATCIELARLGVPVDEHDDGLTIHPCEKFTPACINTYNDHRMAMAFSLIGLRVPGINIENPGCASKTFPGFFTTLESLR